jgi:dihydrofolate reductase
MRRLITTTFVSLDGVMQAPGGPGEDDSGGFRYGGWSANHWDDDMDRYMSDFMGHPFDLLLGRRTYDIFAGFWPTAPEEQGGRPLNEATKYVASRGNPNLDWGPAVLVRDVAGEVAALKRGDGPELQVHGSGNLIQTLLPTGLIDEMRVWTYPVLVGSGRRLFADGTVPAALRLVDSTVTSSGVVIATYQPAGELVTGSFGQG